MGGARGPEWDFVEELVRGRHTSHVRCKSCGHEFHGSATRIKDHLFGNAGNVMACPTPPPNLATKLYKYASKLKAKVVASASKSTCTSTVRVLNEQTEQPENVSLQNEDVDEENAEVSEFAERADSHSSHFTHVSGSRQSSKTTSPVVAQGSASRQSNKNKTPLAAAFDKSSALEMHLKWTQAFVACGISFNVMRNPIFQDALMCTARAGSKFSIPPYNKMRTEYLDKIKHTMEQSISRTVLDFIPSFGCTIALDGWTSCQKKPLINIMCICPRGIVFLDAIDTSLKEKSSAYLFKMFNNAIARVGGPKHVTAICTDNASNYKGAGLMLQDKYPDITWVPCAAHTLNLLLKDIGKMSFVQPTLVDANHLVKFLREHQFTYALFRTKSNKCLQIFCATRFATSYYVLERLLDVRAALVETVADRRFEVWMGKHPEFVVVANRCIGLVTSISFWGRVQKIVDVVKPFVTLIRIVDTDKFVMGKVYWLMSQAIDSVKNNDKLLAKERRDIVFCATQRWTMMHTPLHGAAFALDPNFQIHEQSSNKEVMGNFRAVCTSLLPGDAGKDAFHQRVQFSNRIGSYSDEWCLDAIKHLNPPMWWKEYGSQTVELQHIAVRVLSVAASSGSCERNWSAYDFIHSKRRNRLKADRASALVYLFCNMRLLHKPQSLPMRAADFDVHGPPKQTHDALAEERGSEDEFDEWEVDPSTSNIEEVDDISPVLLNDN